MNARTDLKARLLIGLVVTALSAVSCAGSNKLAQQSEKAYGEGNLDKAYQKAARALRKEPDNRRARMAMSQAASRLRDERETEIRGMAAQDTIAAAKRALVMDSFRAELLEYRVVLPPPPEFDRDQALSRAGA